MKPKSIESFYSQSILGLSLIISACAGIVALPLVVGPGLRLSDPLIQGTMFVAALSMLWGTVCIVRTVRRAQSDYRSSIASLDFETLKRLAESPEVSPNSRAIIVDFLNDNHSGWSLVDKATQQK